MGWFDNLFADERQRRQFEFEREMVQIAQEFQFDTAKHFTENKYQYEVDSMEKAGLNPMMLYKGGASIGGSNIPGGIKGSGTAPSASSDNPLNALQQMSQAKLTNEQIGMIENQKSLLDAQADREKSIAELNRATAKQKGHDYDIFEALNLPSGQQIPAFFKWSAQAGKPKNRNTPGGGNVGSWIRGGDNKAYNLTTPQGRKGFLNSLPKQNKSMWEKALIKKYGTNLFGD